MANPSAVALGPTGRHSPSIGFIARVPLVAGSAVAIIGAVALAGWALKLPVVTTVTTGGYPILPLMALCFVLAGGALTMAGPLAFNEPAWFWQLSFCVAGAIALASSPW